MAKDPKDPKNTKLTKTEIKNSVISDKSRRVLRRVVHTFEYTGVVSKKKVK
jgi:hypothetical protein